MSKKTVIIGASSNPNRYAFMAAQDLKAHKHEIVPLSIHRGEVANEEFISLRNTPEIQDVHTVTMYINPTHQKEWEDYILSLKPNRIIFNPGTENHTLETRATSEGIETIRACTLVMLATNQY